MRFCIIVAIWSVIAKSNFFVAKVLPVAKSITLTWDNR